MATIRVHDGGTRRRRAMIWGGAALLWLLPLLAMQFSDEVDWGAGDFLVFGAMLLAACGGYELVARATPRRGYRVAAGIALLTVFLLVWAQLAVGLI